MHRFPNTCSPERLRTLQRIFDKVWQVQILTGNRRPTEALKDEIARHVAAHADDFDLQPDEITHAVLGKLNDKPAHSLPGFLLRYPPHHASKNHGATALERAFQLASSGDFASVSDIKKRLRAEGFFVEQLTGNVLFKQLKALIQASQVRSDERAAANSNTSSRPLRKQL